jgi:hypothetical protein
MLRRLPSDVAIDDSFPPVPVAASSLPKPITTWRDIFDESTASGVAFDELREQSVADSAARLFRWFGSPRATVLVVWDDTGPTPVECRKTVDPPLTPSEQAPVVDEVSRSFVAPALQGPTPNAGDIQSREHEIHLCAQPRR